MPSPAAVSGEPYRLTTQGVVTLGGAPGWPAHAPGTSRTQSECRSSPPHPVMNPQGPRAPQPSGLSELISQDVSWPLAL